MDTQCNYLIKQLENCMLLDMDGNKLTIGTRVAAADNICGIVIKIGTVVGYTAQRVKVDFGAIKPQSKIPTRLVKVFDQKGPKI